MNELALEGARRVRVCFARGVWVGCAPAHTRRYVKIGAPMRCKTRRCPNAIQDMSVPLCDTRHVGAPMRCKTRRCPYAMQDTSVPQCDARHVSAPMRYKTCRCPYAIQDMSVPLCDTRHVGAPMRCKTCRCPCSRPAPDACPPDALNISFRCAVNAAAEARSHETTATRTSSRVVGGQLSALCAAPTEIPNTKYQIYL